MNDDSDRDMELFNAALSLYRAGKLRESLRVFEKVGARFPDWPQVFHNIGVIYRDLRDNRRAEASFRQVLAIKPTFAASLNGLAGLLSKQRRFDEAFSLYERLLESVQRGREYAHYNYGHALTQQGSLERAAEQYQLSIGMNEYYAPAHYNLGLLMLRKNLRGEAMNCFQRAISLDASHSEAVYELAVCLTHEKRWADAIKAWESYQRLELTDGNSYRNSGICWIARFSESREKSDLDRAWISLKRALGYSPFSLPLWWLLWQCCLFRMAVLVSE